MTIEVTSFRHDPLGLVKRATELRNDARRLAKRERDGYLEYDGVWCIVDVDEHARLPEAKTLAYSNDIELVVSNPCFEIWLLLHFISQNAALSNDQAGSRLTAEMSGYNSATKGLDSTELRGKYAEARVRARRLRERHEGDGNPPDENPSTQVHRLVDALLDEARTAVGDNNRLFGL